jgi:hypothetical protein
MCRVEAVRLVRGSSMSRKIERVDPTATGAVLQSGASSDDDRCECDVHDIPRCTHMISTFLNVGQHCFRLCNVELWVL